MGRPTDATLNLRHARRYLLRLTDAHGSPHTLPGELSRLAPRGEFEWPIAPQSVEYTDQARVALYADADGTTSADEQGAVPPIVTLSGTFGESVKTNSLGVKLDGRQWQRALEAVITHYLESQLKAARQRTPPLRLEWHDAYRNSHLIVTPRATPRGREDNSTPFRETYTLVLTGLCKTTAATTKAADASTSPALVNFCRFARLCAADGVAREPGCINAGVTV